MNRSLTLAGLVFATVLTVAVAVALVAVPLARAGAPSATPNSPGKDASMRQELAPIESADLLVAESYPPQYRLHVKYGLPSGCAKPGGYDVNRNGTSIAVRVWIQLPSDPNTICTMIYGIGEHNIALGSNFQSGQTYTVTLNGEKVESFVAQ